MSHYGPFGQAARPRTDRDREVTMLQAWSVADVRAAEDALLARTPPGALMQRAAAGLAAACARELRARRGGVAGARVLVLAGSGGNGGDALWAGARLAARGASVDAVLVAGRVGGGSSAQGLDELRRCGGRVRGAGTWTPSRGVDLVVDGIAGLGAGPGLREPVPTLLSLVPDTALVVAVDLPSGVDPDGATLPPGEDLRASHVRADLTVTFGAAKPCLLLPPASGAAGRLEVVDLAMTGPGCPLAGLAPAVRRLADADLAALWPVPGPREDKYARGVLGVVAGSDTYPGAAVLATGGALHAGAGMIRYVGPDGATDHVLQHWPEVVRGTGRVQAWLLGSGVDPDAAPDQAAAVAAALQGDQPCVVDAGGLEVLAREVGAGRRPRADLLLTPHAGELARLLGALSGGGGPARSEVEARPLEHARRAADALDATVLLKGHTTLVVPPGTATVTSQADAPAWLATAGAGDVLAGIAGTLLAAGLAPADAGAVAAAVHGRAARAASAGGPLRVLDVARAVPAVVAGLLAAG
ncbi:MAG: NAD(P)H-hydrate dehydratase [Kineosporiaceae bacterium]